jgi:putative ABC transport system permease protein
MASKSNMKIKHLIPTAFHGLKAHKSRSVLTILGIVIGIMAIILVMSIGQGAEQLILNQIQGFGSTTISVEPGREPKGPTDMYEIFTESLKQREVDALKKQSNVRGNNMVEPFVGFIDTISYEDETFRANIYGGSQLLLDLFDVYPDQGDMFTEEDVKQLASVIILGNKVKQELFGDSDALGRRVKIKNRSFRVIGVLPPKGRVIMFNVDEMVIVPYTTAQKYLLGISHYHAIMMKAESEEMVPIVVNDAKETLRELHNITDPEKDDFHISTMADAAARVSTITSILTILLTSVAAISLLVGGIGIMNIMLVSVTERTREIGLRKALGATRSDILSQFLFEAMMLTLIGGIVGILLGAFFAKIAAIVIKQLGTDWVFVFPVGAAILGIIVAGTIGLIFGLYPANQASKKSPIEALRYE